MNCWRCQGTVPPPCPYTYCQRPERFGRLQTHLRLQLRGVFNPTYAWIRKWLAK